VQGNKQASDAGMTGFGGKGKARRLPRLAGEIKSRLGERSIVLVGLMGCGKSSVGRRLAAALDLSFVDADDEIELAAGQSIPEVFARYGEDHFRDRESRIISRILDTGPQVLATGGGAYMRAETREKIAACGISVWLKAELSVLMNRVRRRTDRPLLKTANPVETMRQLMDVRYPVYGKADITVLSREAPHDVMVGEILKAVHKKLVEEATPVGTVAEHDLPDRQG
jgi:shikimate kinase